MVISLYLKMAAAIIRRHLGFLKFRYCKGYRGQGVKMHHCTNFVVIGQTVAEIWQLFDFSKMAVVCHL